LDGGVGWRRFLGLLVVLAVSIAYFSFLVYGTFNGNYFVENINWSYTVNVTYSNYTSGVNTSYLYKYGSYPNVTAVNSGSTYSSYVSNELWNRSITLLPANRQVVYNTLFNRSILILPSNEKIVSNELWNRSILVKPTSSCSAGLIAYNVTNNLDHNVQTFTLILTRDNFPYWNSLQGIVPFDFNNIYPTLLDNTSLYYWISYIDEYNETLAITIRLGLPPHGNVSILIHVCDQSHYNQEYNNPYMVSAYSYNFSSGETLDSTWATKGGGYYNDTHGKLYMYPNDGEGWYQLYMDNPFQSNGYLNAMILDEVNITGDRGSSNTFFIGFIKQYYAPSGTGGSSNAILGDTVRAGLGEGSTDWGLQLETSSGTATTIKTDGNTQQNDLHFNQIQIVTYYYNNTIQHGRTIGTTTSNDTSPFTLDSYTNNPNSILEPFIGLEDSNNDGNRINISMKGLYIIHSPILPAQQTTYNISKPSTTRVCYQGLLQTGIVHIAGGTAIALHSKKWVFGDNQSYIYFGSNNISIPPMNFTDILPINIIDGKANVSISLNLTGHVEQGYGLVGFEDSNGNNVSYYIKDRYSNVYVLLPYSGNYTIYAVFKKGASDVMGDPSVVNYTITYYWDFEDGTSQGWSNNALSGWDYAVKQDDNGDWSLYIHENGGSLNSEPYWYYNTSLDAGEYTITVDVYATSGYSSTTNLILWVVNSTGRHEYQFFSDVQTENGVFTLNFDTQDAITQIQLGYHDGWSADWGYTLYIRSIKITKRLDIRYNIGQLEKIVEPVEQHTYPYELSFYRLNDTSNNTVFLADPDFTNGTVYFDLINGYAGTPHGNVSAANDSSAWLWVLPSVFHDSLVHALWLADTYSGYHLLFINSTGNNVLYDYVITSNNMLLDIPDGDYKVAIGEQVDCPSSTTTTTSGGGSGYTYTYTIPGMGSITPPGKVEIGSPGLGSAGGLFTLLLFLAFYVFYNQRMTNAQALAVSAALSGVISILVWDSKYLGPILVVFSVGIALYYVMNK